MGPDRWIRSVVVGSLAAVVGVEVLSALGWLATGPLIALAVGCLGGLIGSRARDLKVPRITGWGEWVVVTVIVVTAATAVIAAPNTWDSMTYHLSRVEHWLANGSVGHYPTAIDRQLWQPPFAEYLVMLAKALGGGTDRLTNLVQWGGLVGAVAATTWLAELIGADGVGRRLAPLLVVTVPAVILQATSTQNDLLTGCWLLASMAFALAAGRSDPTGREGFWPGAALALAIGTKGTALVLAGPVLGLLGASVWRARGAGAAGRAVAVAAVVAVLPNVPWLARNVETYGSPLGDPVVQPMLRPASLAPAVIVSNAVANGSVHWGTPAGLADPVAGAVLAGVHRLLGVDPGQAYPYFGGLRIVPWSTDEDQAGAPLLFVLGVVAVILAVRHRRRLSAAERDGWLVVAAAMVLFAAGIRWQPYNARLQLPGILLAIPLIATAWSRLGSPVATAVGVAAALTALPDLLGNATRPLVPGLGESPVGSVVTTPRETQYFARRPAEVAAYRAVVDRVRGGSCRVIGLKAGYDTWEYPLWALGRGGGEPLVVEHILVDNPTGRHRSAGPPPCALVAADQPDQWVPNGQYAGWRAAGRAGRLALWLPAPAAR